jgi:putative membrane protein
MMGWFMGGWFIIPIVLCIVVMLFMMGRGGMCGPMMGHGSHDEGKYKNNKTALDILKKRYAKGEIDKKEFEEKKKDLA